MSRKSSTAKNKTDLILAIQELLQNKTVGTQEEIRLALQKQGLAVNQVMISRLLHRIGAIKINEGDQVVYRLPTELALITPNDSLKQLVLNITHNAAIIVIHTTPGCAQFVARFLDQKNNIGILGAVAGDDTIFVTPLHLKKIASVYQQICLLLLN